MAYPPIGDHVVTNATDTAASGSNATVSIAAVAGKYPVIDWIYWSYATTPSSGSVIVTIGSTNVFLSYITGTGFDGVPFPEGLYRVENGEPVDGEAVTVTLANGTAAKYLNVGYHYR